jgi:iron complex transport system permease protein
MSGSTTIELTPALPDLRRRLRLRRWAIGVLAAAALCSALLGLAVGPFPIPLSQVLASLAQAAGLDWGERVPMVEAATVLQLRLPRVLLGLLAGATLAVGGAALQGLLRNPLAEPGLIGVSSGAALAAAAVIVLGTRLPELVAALPRGLLLPLAAFAGGLAATALVTGWARRQGQLSVAGVLLAGIAINALCLAGIGFLSHIADDHALRSLNFWSFGSLGKAGWNELLLAAPLMLLPLWLMPRAARGLNALLLGEVEAGHLGIHVDRLKRRLMLGIALGVGAAVSLAGIIAFVGLLVPHLLRLTLGPDHRLLLPASAWLGGGLLVAADTAARCALPPTELPVGILTTLLGAPFFLWLLRRQRLGDA